MFGDPLLWRTGLPWWLRRQSVCLQCRIPGFDPWVRKIPWRRKWQSTLALLPGKSHGQRSLIGYSPWGRKESDTIERLHFHFFSFSRVVCRQCSQQFKGIKSSFLERDLGGWCISAFFHDWFPRSNMIKENEDWNKKALDWYSKTPVTSELLSWRKH